MIEFVVDTDSCAQLAAYLNRGPLQDSFIRDPEELTIGERLDNMLLMAMVGYNQDEICALADKLEGVTLDRLVELYPPASADEESDCDGCCDGCSCQDQECREDEPDPAPAHGGLSEEIVTVVLNNDERVEVLEGELERYRKELADVRGAMHMLSNDRVSLWKEIVVLREELASNID